jgi:hypothetical protein
MNGGGILVKDLGSSAEIATLVERKARYLMAPHSLKAGRNFQKSGYFGILVAEKPWLEDARHLEGQNSPKEFLGLTRTRKGFRLSRPSVF